MKGFRIGVDGVDQIDIDPDALMSDDITWDCVSLGDDHELWADDQGLSKAVLRVADIGPLRNIPLPAYVLGASGENSADASFDIEQMRSMVRIEGPSWTPEAGDPVLGLEVRFDQDLGIHPWRAVLAFPKEMMHSREFLMRIPEGHSYHGGISDPDHGDLTELPLTAAQQADAIAGILSRRGASTVRVNLTNANTDLVRLLEEGGIAVQLQEVVFVPDDQLDNSYEIGGEAGHEICQLMDPAMTERIKVFLERTRQLIERRRLAGITTGR